MKVVLENQYQISLIQKSMLKIYMRLTNIGIFPKLEAILIMPLMWKASKRFTFLEPIWRTKAFGHFHNMAK